MGMGGVLKEEREGLSERGGGGFGVVAEPPAGVRKGLKLQYSVQPACSLHPAHPSVEQWVSSSATLVVGDRVGGGVQHQKPVQKYHQRAPSRAHPML